MTNHTFETPFAMGHINDDFVVEPMMRGDREDQKETPMYEKFNKTVQGQIASDLVTRLFLRKYISYAKKTVHPILTEQACTMVSESFSRLREQAEHDGGKTQPITVRTLETLIRLATAHAKMRLSPIVDLEDCYLALNLLNHAVFD